ncbi:MAG: glycosyltransferase [Alphaproteobacteria bacterium]
MSPGPAGEASPTPSRAGKVVELRPRATTAAGRAAARPLRTLFLIDELDIGGTEQQILELVRRIDRRRFDPVVCCFRHGAKAREIESLGVPVVHEPKSLKADPGLVLRLARMMRRGRFDIVQTYLWGANTWGRVAARLAGVPHVLASERNVDVWEDRYKLVLGRLLARATDRIIANSEAVRSYLLERGVAPDKVVTIYNGVNFDRFRTACDPAVRRAEISLPPDAILAGTVARVEPAKDHATLLTAFSLIAERIPRLHLAIVGGGSELDRLRGMADDLGVGGRVHFTGARTDAAEWLQSVDFSILSSVKEGLSNTVLESMAAGRAMVATDVGGNGEVVVEGETGYLVPARDPKSLAEAIARLASSEERIRAFGRAGQERVHDLFSVERMVERTQSLYLSIAAPGTRVAA